MNSPLIIMLEKVANALTQELRQEMVFIGGCTTSLFLDPENHSLASRYTYDVDLIVDITTHAEWYSLEEKIRKLGFVNDQEENILCRYRLGDDLIVDLMPTDSKILGFSNYWYEQAIAHKIKYCLPNKTEINILESPYFLATKFEAYKGRGNDDPLMSKDIEDILTVCMGRSTLVEEIYSSPQELRDYLSTVISELQQHSEFEIVLDDQCRYGSKERVKQVVNAIMKQWNKAF
jgi:hypothetical protein